MTYLLHNATPEEMAVPGWEQRRNAAWYAARRKHYAKPMGLPLKRIGRGTHPAPEAIDADPETV